VVPEKEGRCQRRKVLGLLCLIYKIHATVDTLTNLTKMPVRISLPLFGGLLSYSD
jgi:hypothetical protein